MTPEKVLKEVFGYESFRHHQKDIINSVLKGNDSFVLMPTGGGKSLCYQIPALILEGLTVVISPLIALMKDQVDALKLSGVAAAYLNSTQDHHEQAYIMDMLKLNEVKLLYVAPERILGKESNFVDFLKTLDISLIAIDEAHCISHWGHDFRPEYLMLSELAKVLKKKVPTIALTATADKITQKDIVDKLKLENPQVFISSFNRPNIQYHVTPKRNSFDQLLDFLHHNKDESGIVYTLTRKSTEKIADQLTEEGFTAKPYHAGLDTAVKTNHQEAFLKDEVKIIVATIAFGMGIDKSNVRYVVHMDLPKNIESYYQETGRAGRDGLPSQALLFFSFGDVFKLKGFVEIEDNQEQSAIMLQKLDQMAKYGQLKTCRRKYLLNYFGEEFAIHCGACDNCLNTFETIDGTEIAQKALSAVTRLEERFGVNYIIDFLRGSQSEKIWDRHKNLKTYGVGAEISKEDWRHYINELIGLEYLTRDNGKYPILKLGKKSWDVLKKGEKVSVNQPITQRYETETTNTDYEHSLFDQLRTARRQWAAKENLPAYMVFSDATLRELATYLPLKTPDLASINGFGKIKIEKFGPVVVEVISQYCKEKHLSSKIHLKRTTRATRVKKVRAGETHRETLQLFREGKSVAEIAVIRNLSPTTIETHLAHWVKNGQIGIEQLMPREVIKQIKKAIVDNGQGGLKPIKERLPEEITYGQIRLVNSDLKWRQSLKG